MGKGLEDTLRAKEIFLSSIN
ncbi:protein of unknown function [Pseudomonas inefficax]|uniref:Uncharacterized protein n=1 Tax=Pseudomonas inefficax TaxID=2078786 RepID=A0AAQ1PAA9_9PSED|nr:protein of unknown function [Pseudomonas inefficax]